MPVPSDVRKRCQALLDADESIHYLIPTRSTIVGVAMSSIESHVVVTSRRIVVITGGHIRRHRPSSIDLQYPRDTRLGPVEISLTPTIELGSRRYEIDEEYVSAVNAADAELDGAEALPDDPFPDL